MATKDGFSAPVWIDLEDVDPRPASRMRVRLDQEAVADYATDFKSAPPIEVGVDPSGQHWTIDGAHRIEAARKSGAGQIHCRVKKVKTYLEAREAACRANSANQGVRVTNADKRFRVEDALADPGMNGWSQGMIAEHCGVTQQFVSKIRRSSTHNSCELNDAPSSDSGHNSCDLNGSRPTTVTGKDGKSYPAKKSKSRVKSSASKGKQKGKAPTTDPEPRFPRVSSPDPKPDATDAVECDDDPEDDGRISVDDWWEPHRKMLRADFEACAPEWRPVYAMQLSDFARGLLSEANVVEHRNFSL